jgi:2-haloacid dehalogenase
MDVSCISFDCYETLVDWETGIKKAVEEITLGKGARANIENLYRAREDIEFELIHGEYRPYREILGLSLREAFAKFKLPYSVQDGRRLADSVPTWPVFQETKPALEKLKTKCRLCIISNIDNDIIAKTRDRIGVKFDWVVTAQDARAYKPNIRPFQIVLERLGCRPGEILHVSSGYRYDIPPAHQLGFRTAWVNRKQEQAPGGVKPDWEFKNLTELADAVLEASSK